MSAGSGSMGAAAGADPGTASRAHALSARTVARRERRTGARSPDGDVACMPPALTGDADLGVGPLERAVADVVVVVPPRVGGGVGPRVGDADGVVRRVEAVDDVHVAP